MPEGEFVSVHAGINDICGLRSGGEVECWNNFSEDVSSLLIAPSGEFASILGVWNNTACGLRPGGEAECWVEGREGEPFIVDIPPPEFSAPLPGGVGNICGVHFVGRRFCFDSVLGSDLPEVVSGIVGYDYVCGLRGGGEAVCGYFGKPEDSYRWEAYPPAPAGVFTVLTEGSGFFCGLRPGGEAVCWGGGAYGLPSPPGGVFTKIDAGFHVACGLRPSGEVTCWGYGGEQSKIIPPKGDFAGVHAGWGGLEVWTNSIYESDTDWGLSCGLRSRGGVDCWGEGRYSKFRSNTLFDREGEFVQVGAGKEDFCGLRPSGVIECWGVGAGFTPEGELVVEVHDIGGEGYTALSVGGEFACGLRHDGAVDCWAPGGEFPYHREGPYTAVSAGYAHQCGVLFSGDVECWEGDGSGSPSSGMVIYFAGRTCRQVGGCSPRVDSLDVSGGPRGGFVAVSAGWGNACGLRRSGELECWGPNRSEVVSPPAGVFKEVSVGLEHACAARLDGSVTCWVLQVGVNPLMCSPMGCSLL